MGTAGAEVEFLEDTDELCETFLHLRSLAELCLVVKIGLVDHALEQLAVDFAGFGQPPDDSVDSVADLLGSL